MISTVSHTVCLISELISVALKLRFTHLYRDECFRFVAVYTFAVIFQSTLFLMMAVDLFLVVIMPIRHKFWHRRPYVVIMCLPPLAFSILGVSVEKAYVNHEYLLFCSVTLAVPSTIRFWGTLIAFSTVLIAVFLIVITAWNVHLNQQKTAWLVLKHPTIVGGSKSKKNPNVKLLKSLATLMFVFIFSWSLSLALFHVSLYFDAGTRYQVHKYTNINNQKTSPTNWRAPTV
uniref:G_PROTEIN_RECEP_F1_2 domain-containing protein n=1 Tax=Caenorhabditis japonica TaxID=281687 RepID=A0A8R1HT22_CAEJA